MLMARDYLWPQLQDLPYFRALLRAVEARLLQQVDLPDPVLDIGSVYGKAYIYFLFYTLYRREKNL